MSSSPYHAGELEIQRKAGKEFSANRNAQIIVAHLVPGAARYIEHQIFVIVSSQDIQGQIWASVLSGAESFIEVKDVQTIWLNLPLIYSNPTDIFWKNIQINKFIGMLFIEPTTRRRCRVNGALTVE